MSHAHCGNYSLSRILWLCDFNSHRILTWVQQHGICYILAGFAPENGQKAYFPWYQEEFPFSECKITIFERRISIFAYAEFLAVCFRAALQFSSTKFVFSEQGISIFQCRISIFLRAQGLHFERGILEGLITTTALSHHIHTGEKMGKHFMGSSLLTCVGYREGPFWSTPWLLAFSERIWPSSTGTPWKPADAPPEVGWRRNKQTNIQQMKQKLKVNR